MQAVTKIVFYTDEQEKFFGEGPCRLLHAPWSGPARCGPPPRRDGHGLHQGPQAPAARAEQALGFALTDPRRRRPRRAAAAA